MITTDHIQTLLTNGNATVVDQDGDKIGSAEQFFLDDVTGSPEWVTVKTGLFGGGQSFVPLAQATVEGETVRVPYAKALVKDAPRVDDSDGHLSPEQETELYRYYGLDDSAGTHPAAGQDTTVGQHSTAGQDSTVGRDAAFDQDATRGQQATVGHETVGHDTSGPNTDDAMTRSEEQLHVGTTTEATGKARLRKYIVTENVTTTVPVSREEVRIEREPITAENRGDALSGADLTSEEHEVTLQADRVVVDKETVPVERVRLDTETVTEQQEVTEEVRKEQIETDTVDVTATDRRDATPGR